MKKLLALILTLVMVISFVPSGVFPVLAASAEETVPEGYTAVRTVLDLYKVRYDLAANYILMNDIDLTEATAAGGDYDYSGNGWNPIGSDDVYGKTGVFTGIFDGNGHSITGMRIDVTTLPSGVGSELYLGLFANNGGTIKNLHVEGDIKSTNTSITQVIYAGGVSAYNSGTTVACSNEATITVKNPEVAHAGGITAYNVGTVKECYNQAAITADLVSSCKSNKYAGGISGYGGTNSVIENCYNSGDITANSYYSYADSGGIQGYSYSSSASKKAYVKTCYNVGTVVASAIGSTAYRKEAITYISTTSVEVQDCYYLIGTGDGCTGATELSAEQTYIQASYDGFDFDSVWMHNSNAIYEYPQLTNHLQDSRDLIVAEIDTYPEKTTFTKWETFEVVGCTVRFEFSNAETEYVTVTKDMVSGYDMNTVGKQTLTVYANRREFTYEITVLEKDFIPISTPLDLYKVRYDLAANYILMNDIDLSEVTAAGGDYDYSGNGWNPIGSDDVYGKTGKFTGIFDGNGHSITGMRIKVTTLPSGVGSELYLGLFANNGGTIKNLHVEGDIKSTNTSITQVIYAGGVSAYNSGTTVACSNEATITVKNPEVAHAGGITAYNVGTVKECYNQAAITADLVSSCKSNKYAGGISGYGGTNSVIENCYNSGDITANSYYSYAYSGGIQGCSNGSSSSKAYVKTCYNVGTVVASATGSTAYRKAITYISTTSVEVQDCYYLIGTGDSCTGATSLSAALLKEPGVLDGFDFENVWTIDGDPDYAYPELQCFALIGELGVNGVVAYLSTVEADISKIHRTDDTFAYEWLVDGESVGTGATYTLQAADVGKKLQCVVVGSKKYNMGTLYSTEIVVGKAVQSASPITPEVEMFNDNAFTVTTVPTQEYSIDNVHWQASGVFDNLDPNKEYTVYSRILENDRYLLGDSVAALTVTTARRPLSGTVAMVGTAQFGDTLRGDVSAVGPDGATYGYEWKRGDLVVGTDATYTVVEEDIGQSITLCVNGTEDYTGTLTSAAVVATKAGAPAVEAPVIVNKTNTTVELKEIAGLEYSRDRITWQDSPLFTGLSAATEYTFYQRVAETATAFAGAVSSGTKAVTLKNTISAPTVPTVVDVTNNRVVLEVHDGYEYSMDGVTWQESNVFEGLSPNKTYTFYQRVAETAVDYASAVSGGVTKTTLKNTVAALAAPVVQAATDATVTLERTDGCEYSKDGVHWQTSNVFTGLEPLETYTFYQRRAETETDYAGAISAGTSFKVKYVVVAPTAPTLVTVTNSTITVATNEGYRYSLDGESWRGQGLFTGLSPNKTYTVYCYIPESDTYYASPISNALVVTTLKNTVDKVGVPTSQKVTNNAVTLVPQSGYEYSKDGDTWQSSNVFDNLLPNTTYTFYQRIKETDTDYAGEISDALTVTTLKNTVATPSAPVVESKTTTSVTLVAKSGYEYSKDKITWQDSPVFEGLTVATTYTFYQRVKETESDYVSGISGATQVTTSKNGAPVTPTPIIESVTSTTVTLKPVAGCEYMLDGSGNTWQSSNVFTGLKPNTTYYFKQRYYETATTYAGTVTTVSGKTTKYSATAPQAPTIVSVSGTTVTLKYVQGYEYSKNGTVWQTSATFSNLTPNTTYTFYQRVAETTTTYASPASAGTSAKVKMTPSTPAAPTFVSGTATSITVNTVSGYQYSLNKQTWQNYGTFTGLSPYTMYSIYCRKAETDDYYQSAVSPALMVTTLKNTVTQTPTAPVLVGKTDVSVTLATRAGYEYSKNGTVWQSSPVFNNLTPNTAYTFYQRIAETATNYASSSSPALSVRTDAKCVYDPQLHQYDNATDTTCNACGKVRLLDVYTVSGNTASVSTGITGTGYSFEWYFKDPANSNFSKSSVTTATYTTPMTAAKSGRVVYCVITDPNGNVQTTNRATLYLKVAIVKQPANTRAKINSTVKVSLTASGDGLTYVWYYKNAGASTYTRSYNTAATYSTTMANATNGRQVYCVITDKYGNKVTSNVVKVSIAATVTTQPQSVSALSGNKVSTTLKAAGEGVTYTWYYKDPSSSKFVKSSITSATYSTTMKDSNNGRQVYCVVKDKYGYTDTSKTVTLSLRTPVAIVKQPVNTRAKINSTVKVSLTAKGDGLTYVWYYKNAGASTYTRSYNTAATYSTTMANATNGRQVYCVITDKYGDKVTSNVVKVSIAATVTTQPQSVSALSGNKVSTTLKAAGEGVTYTWYFKDPSSSKFVKSSITSATYSTTMKDSNNGRQVYCVVKDKYGYTDTSKTVTLTLRGKVSIIQQPSNVSANIGNKVSTTVKATGDGLTYTWYYKNAGSSTFNKSTTSTTATYSMTLSETNSGRTVYCVVKDAYGQTVTSNQVVLYAKLGIVKQPDSMYTNKGNTISTSVTAVGYNLTYTWYYKDPSASSFAKSSCKTATYSCVVTDTSDGREVYCVIKDGYGNTVTTDTVTLNALSLFFYIMGIWDSTIGIVDGDAFAAYGAWRLYVYSDGDVSLYTDDSTQRYQLEYWMTSGTYEYFNMYCYTGGRDVVLVWDREDNSLCFHIDGDNGMFFEKQALA